LERSDRSDALLDISDLHTYYGDSYVLQGLDLRVSRGQVVAILGRNGMGKTTLIRSVFGLTPARQGVIRYRGQEIRGLAPYKIAKLGLSLVPQSRRIFRNLSVLENLKLPSSFLAARRRSATPGSRPDTWSFDSVLDEFPQLRDRLSNGGSELSGGEQQMLAIARALVVNPDLILMDEPSEGLSPLFVQHVGQIMRRVKQLGHAILLVEQNLRLALSVADYVHIISSGRFVFSGTPDELAGQPDVLNEHLGVSGAKSLH
jgi:branched-chain amino acid transport system ATP-binding protein